MKNLFFSLLSAVVLWPACKKDDDNSSNSVSVSSVNSTVATGAWRVTLFNENGTDRTANFSGYSFVFAANNTLTATKSGANTETGSWAAGTDDSKTKLIIDFASPSNNQFESLSEDWHVTSRTDAKIVMQHISGGNGTTDFLTLER